MDTLTRAERSQRMSLIGNKNTKPELALRSLVHRMGYRYRLHDGRLPGKPDLVFPSRRGVIFMHGCFWHRHKGCCLNRLPKSKLDFWKPKLEQNKRRDARNQTELKRAGWQTLVVWECELQNEAVAARRVKHFLRSLPC